MQKTKYIAMGSILMMILAIYMGFRLYRIEHTQVISMKAVTEGAVGAGNAIPVTARFYVKEPVIPGREYQAVVQFQIVDRHRIGLYSKDSGDTAYFKCSELEMERSFTARENQILLDLDLKIAPGEISDNSGNLFDPDTQILMPVTEITERD